MKANLRLMLPGILSVALLTISCDRDAIFVPSVNYYPLENPLPGFLSTTQFNQDETPYIDKPVEEMGFAFKPSANGHISSVVVKIPDTVATGTIRVTIWDKDLATPIHTAVVPVTNANEAVTYPIGQIALTKDKAYAITMQTTDWYNRRRFDISAMPFPVVSGNIVITGSGFGPGAGQQMPANLTRPNYYDGDVSFIFRRIE
jgi:hypothetical protein